MGAGAPSGRAAFERAPAGALVSSVGDGARVSLDRRCGVYRENESKQNASMARTQATELVDLRHKDAGGGAAEGGPD